jgi:superfamily II DNA or RNA helicase
MLLEAMVGPVVHKLSYGTMIERKRLVPVTFHIVDMPPKRYKSHASTEATVHKLMTFAGKTRAEAIRIARRGLEAASADTYREIYVDYVLNNALRDMVGYYYVRRALRKRRTVAIIVKEIEHGRTLAKLLPEAEFVWAGYPGVGDERARARYPSRKAVWAAFKERKQRVVISTLLDEAVNIPSLDVVVMMAGGKSITKFIQRLRNLRSFEGKTVDGYTKKTRGYVFYPRDSAKWLSGHSRRCLAVVDQICGEHPLNKRVNMDWMDLVPRKIRRRIGANKFEFFQRQLRKKIRRAESATSGVTPSNRNPRSRRTGKN